MTIAYRVEHRNSRSAKQQAKWYKPLAEYIMGMVDPTAVSDIKDKKDAVDGVISDAYYKKVLNPFNATDKKFTRWRAEMRNYDIMRDVIRRYLGEYSKQPFDFQVKANDPDVITRFNDAFAEQVTEIAIQIYINQLNANGIDTGQETQEVPDFNTFFKKFKEDYMDDVAAQGQAVLSAIIDWTDSVLKYYTAFYNYIVLGQCYTYRDIRGDILHKEVIDPIEYHPISNGEPFIEDHNNGVRTFSITLPQIIEEFGTILDEKTLGKVKHLFETYTNPRGGVFVPLVYFKSIMDDATYSTLTKSSSVSARIGDNMYRLTNKDNTIDGAHIVFTTQVKVGHLLYIDPITGTMQEDIIEADSFELDPNQGHISITWEWWNEFWEMYRFGVQFDDIYTVPRPIAYQRRDGNNPQKIKSPYNGLCEVVPGTGFTFSIPDAILPFQIARNIFAFYRERIISKNKDKVLVIPKSLLGDATFAENAIYRLEANSVFAYDDENDDSGTKAQHIRVLDASLSQFVSHITDLMDRMKDEAWDTVDMNRQRYGEIQTSAGKATTEEAIIRSSMGSVILFTMFERFLEKEYLADLDYSKSAYKNGKRGSYTDLQGETQFLDLEVDKHILANYGLHVVSSVNMAEKKKALKEFAFATAQGGEYEFAIEAILNDNIASIKKAFKEYNEAKKAYEASVATQREELMAQAEQAKAQAVSEKLENDYNIAEMQETAATERLVMELRIKVLDIESRIASNTTGDNTNLISELDQAKLDLERMKINNDMVKHRDNLSVKREDIRSKEKIAASNRQNRGSK